MHADSFFTIGSSHTVCQDYARTFLEGEACVAVLSDGCSSAVDSDFGSRLLVTETISHIKTVGFDNSPKSFSDWETASKIIGSAARKNAISLGLKAQAIDATLLVAVADQDRTVGVIFGDGAIVYRLNNGELVIEEVRYSKSYPGYISYVVDDRKREAYAAVGEECHLHRFIVSGDDIIAEPPTPIDCLKPHWVNLPTSSISCIALISDGISSFYRTIIEETSRSNIQVPMLDVLPELMAFARMKGQFVQRRVRKGLARFAMANVHHADDVSVAAIAIQD